MVIHSEQLLKDYSSARMTQRVNSVYISPTSSTLEDNLDILRQHASGNVDCVLAANRGQNR